MFTQYSLNEPPGIGKFPWKAIWRTVKAVASTFFPGPYAIAAGAVGTYESIFHGGAGASGIGATSTLTDDQKEKLLWKKLVQTLTPDQRAAVEEQAAKQLGIAPADVAAANVEAASAPDPSPVNPLWYWCGGAALLYWLFK